MKSNQSITKITQDQETIKIFSKFYERVGVISWQNPYHLKKLHSKLRYWHEKLNCIELISSLKNQCRLILKVIAAL